MTTYNRIEIIKDRKKLIVTQCLVTNNRKLKYITIINNYNKFTKNFILNGKNYSTQLPREGDFEGHSE